MARSTLIASLALGAAIPVSLLAGSAWAQDAGAQRLIPLSELKARQNQRQNQRQDQRQPAPSNGQFPVIEAPLDNEGPVIIEAPLPEPSANPAPQVDQPLSNQPRTEAPQVQAPAVSQPTANDLSKPRSGGGKITPSAIEQARYQDGPLPDGATAITVKVQVLLDRAGISPGVIDGAKGGMTESALLAFEEQQGLPIDGHMDAQVWDALGGDSAGQITGTYTISVEDTQGLSQPLPSDYAELAKLDQIGFTRVSERLAERFHMDEDFLKRLNPGASFRAGETLNVIEPGQNASTVITEIVLDKSARRLRAFDATGRMVTNYPVTIGSAATPSPSGTHTVLAVAPNPTYTYNPKVNFTQGENKEVLILPPGPNGPVGSTWIDLSKPTYGIHGTANPSTLFSAASHGCVRLTNWDAGELAKMVREGTTVTFTD